nr:homoserine kinase [Quercus suber]
MPLTDSETSSPSPSTPPSALERSPSRKYPVTPLENSAAILTPITPASLRSSAVVPPLEQFSSTNCSAGSSGRRSWYSLELKSEEKVSDYHTDNVGPVIMGGFVLIRNYEPLDLKKLNFREKKDLYFVLAVALAAAVLEGDVAGLGKALSGDRIVEPRQAPLILGMEVVKKVAIEAGAFGCTISGARPTAVAMIDCEERGEDCGEDGGGVLEKRGIKGGGGSESA